MLMPRLQYHLNGYNPEMSITLSMQHQQQHINQLLNTAATATGIVGDVDALLTPIQNSNTMPVRAEHSRERNLWRTNEIMEMLIIMQEIKALEMLSVKTIKSDMVFRKVERIMHLRGFRKKSHVQIWTKWKFLKSTYTTSRRNGIIPKMIPQPIYEELHKMLQNVNSNCSGRSTSDCGNSATSLDGDDSNGATANNCSNDNESKLVISGVEGGYSVGSKKSLNGCVAGPESDEENGLAHPIFGFRLGLVKQEPADTGYECSNIKEKDTTDNIQFQTEVKQEVTEPGDPPSASTSPSRHVSGDEQLQQQPLRQSLPEIMILSRRTTRPTPTTNTTTTISTPKATSTPKSNISVSQTQPGAETPTLSTPPPLPPLRIARFAKIPPSEITTADSNINLPPPPLTMNPTSQTLRLRHYNSGTYTVNGKGNSNTNILTYTRKFATINPQAVTITTPGHQTTVHPYIRPQEVVVPDLHVTAAPHEHRAPQPFYGFPDGPSTSQQAQQQQVQEIEARKRRLKASLLNAMPPKRMPRAPETLTKPTSRQAKSEFNSEINDDGLNDSPNEDDYIHQEPPQQGGAQASPENTERNSSYPKVLQDMAISLRQMQREAINEFFKHQMKLAREEHEFQMRQDALLMQAFKEQAQQFQLMSKELMGSSVKLEKRKKRLEKQAQKQFTNNKKMHTRQMQDRTGGNAKVLLNGVNKPKVEHKEVLEESKKEVKVLMRNIHAQLELTEDEVDDDEQNQYEYDVSAYLQDNSTGSLMQKSALTPEPPGDIECSEENNITSDPVQILG